MLKMNTRTMTAKNIMFYVRHSNFCIKSLLYIKFVRTKSEKFNASVNS